MDTEVFCQKYKDAFLDLIKTPLVTCCKHKNQIIPYEYAPPNQAYKRWRTEDALSEFFKNHPSFMAFCLQNDITKYLLQVVYGGNLLAFKWTKEAGF